MPITVQLDKVLTQRRVLSKDLAKYVGISEQNMSLLRKGKVKGIRFSTLEKICEYLECQPADIIRFEKHN